MKQYVSTHPMYRSGRIRPQLTLKMIFLGRKKCSYESEKKVLCIHSRCIDFECIGGPTASRVRGGYMARRKLERSLGSTKLVL